MIIFVINPSFFLLSQGSVSVILTLVYPCCGICQNEGQDVFAYPTFWLTTECRSRAYAILICLSSSLSSSSLSLSSVSTPPDHMLGQIRFILCMHMQLYPV